MVKIAAWICGVCWDKHPTYKEALACEARGTADTSFSVGDEVEVGVYRKVGCVTSISYVGLSAWVVEQGRRHPHEPFYHIDLFGGAGTDMFEDQLFLRETAA